jgi:hypothetical protein
VLAIDWIGRMNEERRPRGNKGIFESVESTEKGVRTIIHLKSNVSKEHPDQRLLLVEGVCSRARFD